MNRFADRNAIVTGASRGIGAGIAERLAAEGAHLAVVARTDGRDHLDGSLNETVQRCRRYGAAVEAISADLADPVSRAAIVPRALEFFNGRIDILVNNAAAQIYMPTIAYPYTRQRIMFEVNVHAPIELAQGVVPGMIERGAGWIVNVSSAGAALTLGPPFAARRMAVMTGVYGATKAALNRASNAMAVELYGRGVRVNTIQPRAAVMTMTRSAGLARTTEGPIDEADDIEPLEAIVEATLVLCDCPAEHTGRAEVSLDLLERFGITIMTIDGTARYSQLRSTSRASRAGCVRR